MAGFMKDEDEVAKFCVSIAEMLDRSALDEAFEEIMKDSNDTVVKWAVLELFHIFGSRMADSPLLTKDAVAWTGVQGILEYLTKIGSAKEVLIGLLDLAERAESDEFFHLVLPLLKIAFIRLPGKRGESLLWALCSVLRYIRSLPAPPSNQVEDAEAAVLENCPISSRLETCLGCALDFSEAFVSEARSCCNLAPETRLLQRQQLVSYLLKLVEFPVAQLTVTCDPKKYTTDFYSAADRLVGQINQLSPDLFWKVLEWHESRRLCMSCDLSDPSSEQTLAVSDVAVGTLAYLIWVEGLKKDRLPTVWSHFHVFQTLLPYLNAMLKSSFQDQILHKGVLLAHNLISFLDSDTKLDRQHLAQTDYYNLLFGLFNVMQSCSLRASRCLALETLRVLLRRMEPAAQLAVVRLVFNRVGADSDDPDPNWCLGTASGIRGWCIDFCRHRLHEDIQYNRTDFHSALPEFLELFEKLKGEETTDLLDNFDHYMATLNLIRYVCIRSAKRELQLSSEVVQRTRSRFLEPLRKAVELSSAHYKLEMRKMKEACQQAGKKNMSLDSAKIDMMNTALTSLELLNCLLIRVIELAESI